jgi:hypothetical protein
MGAPLMVGDLLLGGWFEDDGWATPEIAATAHRVNVKRLVVVAMVVISCRGAAVGTNTFRQRLDVTESNGKLHHRVRM